MKLDFHYGFKCDSLEEQANAQGFTLGELKTPMQVLHASIVMLRAYSMFTDNEYDEMIRRLNEFVTKNLKRVSEQ